MNKAQLIEALTDRLGDKKAAGAAVDGLVDVIVRTVNKGEKVNITGFGVFEKRARAARNPRTGETVKVKKTNVPAFRAGTTFKDVVSGAKKLPKVAAPKKTATAARGTAATTRTAAARPASRATATTTRTRTTAAKPATTRTTAAKTTAVKATTAKKAATPAKATATKRTTAAKKK